MKSLQPLNPLLHSELRLAIMSLLLSVETADFNYLKDATKATAGNLSVQLGKLKDAEYISIDKGFKDNYPSTTCRITRKGIEVFEKYVKTLKEYLKK